MRFIIILFLSLWLTGCERFNKGEDEVSSSLDAGIVIDEVEKTAAGEIRILHLKNDAGERIAVKITYPNVPRYEDGAPVVVNISTFFTNNFGFYKDVDAEKIGAIHISYLWPGRSDRTVDAVSDGEDDYGGENAIAALREVIRFATGEIDDENGINIIDMSEIPPLLDNVGLWAFSHPGLAAVNVMAHHGDTFSKLKYFVGRENPTVDTIASVEIGYWDETQNPVINPNYSYPDSYSPFAITMDYTLAGWLTDDALYSGESNGRAFIGNPGGDDFILSFKIPTMWNKRYYSMAMTHALLENGALTLETWPEDLATPDEVDAVWPYQISTGKYLDIKANLPELKVMLVFGKEGHVNPMQDIPQVHQAWEGFRFGCGYWVRLNPDAAYALYTSPASSIVPPDNDANDEPGDWAEAYSWGYTKSLASSKLYSLAALAEMADRVQEDNWELNLGDVLVEGPAVSYEP